jgi:TonB-dependent starch-binding outer membrane protein SusC
MQENATCKGPAIAGTEPRLFAFEWDLTKKIGRIMKLTAMLLLAVSLQVAAKGLGQEGVTLKVNNAPLERVFATIKEQTGYYFIYRAELIAAKKVSIHVTNVTLKEALDRCLENQKLAYNIVGKSIVISMVEKAKAEIVKDYELGNGPLYIEVKGKVVNESGEPVSGVTVAIKGSNQNTLTDANGEFTMSTVDQNAILVFTHISMEKFELKVSGKKELAITLRTKITALGNVQVVANTGYEVVKPNEVNGSVVVIDNKMLNQQTGTNILQRLNNVSSSLFLNVGKSNATGGVPSKTNLNVRGFSTLFGSTDPLIVLDNFIYEGDINNINPNDVENVTILKDASAASIWGARAGNGVIIITTKGAKFSQKVKVEFNANTIFSQKPDLYYLPQMSVADYIDVEQYLFNKGFKLADTSNVNRLPFTPVYEILLKRKNGKISAADSANQIDALKSLDSRDQYDKYYYKHALTQQYSLNVRGGSANSSWMFSGAFDKSISALNQHYNKGNLRIENSYRPIRNMQLKIGANYTNSRAEAPSALPAYNNLKIYAKSVPYLQFMDEYGFPIAIDAYYRGIYTDTVGGGKLLNWKYYPAEDINHDRSTIKLQEIIANVALNYQIIKSLSASINYQYQNQWSKNERYADLQSYYARDLINRFTNLAPSVTTKYPIPVGGILQSTNNWIRSQNARAQLNFKNEWGSHAVTALLGGEVREVAGGGDNFTLYGYNPDPLSYASVDFRNTYQTIVNGGFQSIPGNPYSNGIVNNRFVSLYGNVLYSFKKRYTFSASARRDGSNIFGSSTNDKWKPLWSVGAGWAISKEVFYKFSWIPELRLKSSFGYSGNIDSRKTPLPIATYGSNAPNTGLPYAFINSINNPGLKWEKVSQYNIGLEFSSIKNIVSGSIEFYKKKGADLYALTPYDYTAWSRLQYITKNAASMESKGFDIVLNTQNINKAFKWETNLLISHNTNKTTSYYTTSAQPITDLVVSDGNLITPVEGKPLYAIAAYKWGGLSANGDPQGYVNGQLSTDYAAIFTATTTKGFESETFEFIGPANPVHFGAMINTFDWKGFSLSFNVGYKLGYYLRKPSINYNGLFENGDGHKDFEKRWQKPGDEAITNVPALVYTNYPQFIDRDKFYMYSKANVIKGDHVRFNYINFSYSFMKVAFFNQLQLYVNAANLGVIWRSNDEGIDPDYPATIPPPKAFTVGIRGSL